MPELIGPARLPEIHIPGLRFIKPGDDDELKRLFEKTKNMQWLWEDRMRLSVETVIQSMLWLWGNPANVMIDVANGAGALSVVNIIPGFRGFLYAAAWDRAAMGKKAWPLWRAGCAVAMAVKNLHALEALIAEPNTLGWRLAENCGMEYRRTLPGFLCYNGARLGARHYEISRSHLTEFFGDTG